MTKMKTKRQFARISAIAITLAATAVLPAFGNEWKAWANQDPTAPRVIYTDDATALGAVLACNGDSRLTAIISTQPGSFPDLLKMNAPYKRSEKAMVSVGDQSPQDAKVTWIPAINVVQANSHMVAAKVFNATVLGEPFKMDVKHGDDVDARFPPPNDVFQAFADTCQKSRSEPDES
ncbi:MAG: hypothetical protein VR74_17615 [Hyphomonas sp. BRH_c22]|nr:MAG: hypothetical protein VR74_17615 [Hyphomonas sp. BRH_c22]